MSKIRVGDIVKTKRGLKEDKWYGTCIFNEGMREYEGKLAKVIKKNSNGSFKLDIDNKLWNWTEEMLVPYRELVTNRLEVRASNIKSLTELEVFIMLALGDYLEQDLEDYEYDFIIDLATACLDYKIERTLKEED